MSLPNLVSEAFRYCAGGLSLIPIGQEKKPFSPLLPRDPQTDKPEWKPYQKRAADEATVRGWCAVPGVTGIAAVCGAVSGGLLILDFDEPRMHEAWTAAVGPLADGLPVQRTGEGFQVALRCDEPGPNQVLAWVPDQAAESGRRVGIETRGEGGYALLPGSLHPNGRIYGTIAGDFAAIPHIPMGRVRLLMAAARQLDEAPQSRQELERARRAAVKPRTGGAASGGVIQEWNRRVPIRDMLLRAGYPYWRGDRYTRPGPDASPGGVIVFDDARSYHHSTNDPLPDGHAHDSFSIFCELEHHKDTRAAVKAAATELGLEHSTAGADQPSTCQASPPRKSQATLLIELIESDPTAELFHTPGGHDSEAYATIQVETHRETWPVQSRAFQRWLARRFYVEHGRAPGGQGRQDAITVLAGKALYEGPEREVRVRLARHAGSIWLDLADPQWRIVEASPSGWRIVSADEVPVRFVRKRGMLALPEPRRGGSLNDLRGLVNLPDEQQWVLGISWLVSAVRPGLPTPLLNISGEQGSCKSTLSRMFRGLIDPNQAALRSPPKDERDLVIAAGNAHVVAFDNLSGISPALSDAICRLATGGGFGTRELYSDDNEKLFDGVRPVILNGIDDVITRADALDRAISLVLPVVPEDKRQDEQALWARFEHLRPGILGALLDAVCVALQNLPSTRLERKPRMADFANWGVAAEPALPWSPGSFLRAYTGNRDEGNALAVESSTIGPPLLALLSNEGSWSGTFGGLCSHLEERYTDERVRAKKDWPANPKAMSNAVRRIAPNLRALGYGVDIPVKATGHRKQKVIRLEQRAGEHAASPAPPANAPVAPASGPGEPPVAERGSLGRGPNDPQLPALGGATARTTPTESPVAVDAGCAGRPPGSCSLGALPVGHEGNASGVLTPDQREEFEERAGVMQHDGELPREQAEALALRDMAALKSDVNGTPPISPESKGDGTLG